MTDTSIIDTLKTVRFTHRILIILCLTILSITIFSNEKENYYDSAITELNKLTPTFKEIKDYYSYRINKLKNSDKFLNLFKKDYQNHIDSSFEADLIPTEWVEVNDSFAIETASIIPRDYDQYFKEGTLDFMNENLERYYEEYLSYLGTDLFVGIKSDEKLPLDDILNNKRRIVLLKTEVIRAGKNTINDSIAFLRVYTKTINSDKKRMKLFKVRAIVQTIGVRIDSILRKNELMIDKDGKKVFFPKLKKIWRRVDDKNIDEAGAELEGLSLEWVNSNKITLFGFQLERKQSILFASPIVIMFIMFYFLSTILHLISISKKRNEEFLFPWIGLYSNTLGKIVNLITILILPSVTCLSLLRMANSIGLFAYIRSLSSILFLLGYFILLKTKDFVEDS